MTELTKRLEFTQDQLERKPKNITKNIKHLETSIKGIERDLLDPNHILKINRIGRQIKVEKFGHRQYRRNTKQNLGILGNYNTRITQEQT